MSLLSKFRGVFSFFPTRGASFLVSFINTKTQKEVKAIITTFGDDAVKNAVKNAVSGAAMVGEHESLEFLRVSSYFRLWLINACAYECKW